MRGAHLKRLGLAAALAVGLGVLPGMAAAEHGERGSYVRVEGGRHYGGRHDGDWRGYGDGHHRGYRRHYGHGGRGYHDYRPRHYDRYDYGHHYRPRYGYHGYYRHHRHHRHCGHGGYGGYGGDHAASLGLLLGYTLLYGDE